jgi:glycoprotein endo-alpha-1,2-mannosidase
MLHTDMEMSNNLMIENNKNISDEKRNDKIVNVGDNYMKPPSKVHIFYYAWYRNKEHDSSYDHWNHKVLPHWLNQVNSRYKNINQPSNVVNNEIGSNFFPKLGLYSSLDTNIIKHHLTEIRDKCNINSIIISYWGGRGDENISKEQAEIEHAYLEKLFSIAEGLGVYIIFHLEPYKYRTATSTINDVKYLIDTYGKSKAFYRVKRSQLLQNTRNESEKSVPLFYVYDSYLIQANDWKQEIDMNIHNNEQYDSIIIGLYTTKQQSERFILDSSFDGFYTYFGATGFTYGSTPTNWKSIHKFALSHSKIFIPSVAPGYIDTRIRPWNSQNVRNRNHGNYYDNMWKMAIDSLPSLISVTSYNEWHEGTQIEPAVPATFLSSLTGAIEKYLDYTPNDPEFYLTKTAYWVNKFELTANSNQQTL